MGRCINCGNQIGILQFAKRFCENCEEEIKNEHDNAVYELNRSRSCVKKGLSDIYGYIEQFNNIIDSMDTILKCNRTLRNNEITGINKKGTILEMHKILDEYNAKRMRRINSLKTPNTISQYVINYQLELKKCLEKTSSFHEDIEGYLRTLSTYICDASDNINKEENKQNTTQISKPKASTYFFSELAKINTGIEFEEFCARILNYNGFVNVEVTKASNDYGVDVIAKKDDIKYAIQCKFYTSTLGNTPVQEISAGMTYYKCHVGVVLTNSTFTKNAIELAEKTNILLWDRKKLSSLIENAKTAI